MAGTPLTDLEKPLGQDRTRPAASSWSPQRWARPVAVTVAASVGAIIAGLALLVAIHRDPDGGEPIATAQIVKREPPAPAVVAAPPIGGQAGPFNQSSARQMEGESGVTVVRPGSDAPGAIVITIPDSDQPVTLAPASDPRLTERSRYGLLPRIGSDGATPSQVYARPFLPPSGAKPAGHIALIVGGLGISQSGHGGGHREAAAGPSRWRLRPTVRSWSERFKRPVAAGMKSSCGCRWSPSITPITIPARIRC